MKKSLPKLSSVETLIKYAIKGIDHKNWYYHEHEKIKAEAKELNLCPNFYADIIAVTSPRIQVSRNKPLAKQWIFSKSEKGMLPNTAKALHIYEKTGKINGQKTSEFAKALKGDYSAIVLDVWMAKAFKIDQALFSRKPVQVECKKRIRKAAKVLNIEPAELQASVWYGVIMESNKSIENKTL